MKQTKTFLLSFVILITLLAAFNSCKKSNDPAPPVQHTIEGLWIGTITNASASEPYNLSIKPDGKITFESIISGQEQFGAGTWTLSGSNFSANVTTLYGVQSNVGVQQRLTATFNSSSGALTNGQFTNTSPANDSGTFSVTEVE